MNLCMSRNRYHTTLMLRPISYSRAWRFYIISHLTALVFIIEVLNKNAQADRVGPKQQYECNCQDEKCDKTTGLCEAGIPCADNYFGVACQYVNLLVGQTLDTPVLNDQNITTCYSGARKVLFFNMNPTRFTFLRIVFKDSSYLTLLHVLLIALFRNDAPVPCARWSSVPFDGDQVEFHCLSNMANIDKILMSGDELIPLLCEVYVSGGRNVALYKDTTLTSNSGEDFISKYAVDGNYENGFKEKECIQTAAGDAAPTFEVIFEYPHQIDYFIIRNPPTGGAMKFELTTEDEEKKEVFKHTDISATPEALYKIHHNYALKIKQIKLKLSRSDIVLSFCEFEAYGDCPPGGQGLQCDEKCNPACANQKCTLTGTCIECGDSKYGENCDSDCPSTCTASSTNGSTCDRISRFCLNPCAAGMYGTACSLACSANCGGSGDCDLISGACKEGCKTGYSGDTCTKADAAGAAADATGGDAGGKDDIAEKECSPNCGGHGECDKTSGACSEGCKPGFHGAQCSEAGSDGEADKACSPNCGGDGQCDEKTGVCSHGCKPGFSGSTCAVVDPESGNGKECSKNCAGKKTCNSETGLCLEGCMPGYGGANCSTDCGYCIESICDRETLACPKGCKAGEENSLCPSPITEDKGDDPGTSRNMVYFFVFMAIALCCAMVLILRKEKPTPLIPE